MKKLFTYITILTTSILFYTSCTEQYEPKTGTFENALVIESTITNELKKQTIKLSRIRKLESEFSNKESNAQVWIEANNTTYSFSEMESGIYLSDIAFKAVPDTEYNLFITTQNGKKYKSNPVFLTPEAPISNLYVQTETVNNQLGAQIFIDNNNSGNAKYFRYEFEETYKIITPYNIFRDLHLGEPYYIEIGPLLVINYSLDVTPTIDEKHICYTTEKQDVIIQSSLTNSSENNIIKFPIRFINYDDPIIRSRYSILVKQYVQDFDSYNFYSILKRLGSIESLLTENQTGLVKGNVFSVDDNTEKVIGFFDVSTVSEKRIFFNYENFNFEQPKYLYECVEYTLDYNDYLPILYDNDWNERYFLYQFFSLTHPPYELTNVETINGELRIFTVTNPECGNCSTFAATIRPDFWVD